MGRPPEINAVAFGSHRNTVRADNRLPDLHFYPALIAQRFQSDEIDRYVNASNGCPVTRSRPCRQSGRWVMQHRLLDSWFAPLGLSKYLY